MNPDKFFSMCSRPLGGREFTTPIRPPKEEDSTPFKDFCEEFDFDKNSKEANLFFKLQGHWVDSNGACKYKIHGRKVARRQDNSESKRKQSRFQLMKQNSQRFSNP